PCQVGPEDVRRSPAEILGYVGFTDDGDLREQGDDKEGNCGMHEAVERRTGLRLIDEGLRDLRVGELKTDPGKQHDAEQRSAGPLRFQVLRKQRTVELR